MKECLETTGLDEDTFEAARETCLVLGGKLGSIRNQQSRCYTDTRQLEVNIDNEILASKIEAADLADIDLRFGSVEKHFFGDLLPQKTHIPPPLLGLNVSTDPLPPRSSVRGRTPVRQLSPTPLSRHRSRSREPSQCGLGGASLAEVCVGRSNTPDPTAYFSRSGSSLSLYGGRGSSQTDPFRLAMEAKQAQDDHQVSL